MRLLSLQHVPFETPAGIAVWAKSRGYAHSTVLVYDVETLPGVEEFDCLVVMGGPMSVGDVEKHPWLAKEKDLIAEAIAAEKFVLGVCLGAQLLAEALGSRVYPGGAKEIGWFPIVSQNPAHLLLDGLPNGLDVLHWHGDTFDLPNEAELLYSSELYPNQAFIWRGRCLGVQFHLEMGRAEAAALCEHCADELEKDAYIQSAEQIVSNREGFEVCREVLFTLLDSFCSGH